MSFTDDIAEAICNAHSGDTEAWEITYDKGRDHWRHVATAALDAIADFNARYPKQEDMQYAETPYGPLGIRFT